MAVDEALLFGSEQTIVITTLNSQELPLLEEMAEDQPVRKMYQCNKCDKAYYHSQSLVRHRTLECGKEPRISCPHCPYRSKQKADMKKHINRKHSVICLDQDDEESDRAASKDGKE